ncbi:hypothetical protein QLX08_003706 [Tetragonisca angustula]|uniref:Uncharacterized protein n=1 Tax=Tetragonisca angustula TaxID=166442 RepID=A0AAW1A5X4_9HYME
MRYTRRSLERLKIPEKFHCDTSKHDNVWYRNMEKFQFHSCVNYLSLCLAVNHATFIHSRATLPTTSDDITVKNERQDNENTDECQVNVTGARVPSRLRAPLTRPTGALSAPGLR